MLIPFVCVVLGMLTVVPASADSNTYLDGIATYLDPEWHVYSDLNAKPALTAAEEIGIEHQIRELGYPIYVAALDDSMVGDIDSAAIAKRIFDGIKPRLHNFEAIIVVSVRGRIHARSFNMPRTMSAKIGPLAKESFEQGDGDLFLTINLFVTKLHGAKTHHVAAAEEPEQSNNQAIVGVLALAAIIGAAVWFSARRARASQSLDVSSRRFVDQPVQTVDPPVLDYDEYCNRYYGKPLE